MQFSYRTDDLPAIVSAPVDLCAVICPEGFAGEEGSPELRALDEALGGLVSKLATHEQFAGKKGQSLHLHTHGKVGPQRILLLGVGKSQDFLPSDLRPAAARAARAAAAAKCQSLLLVTPSALA